MRTLVAAFIIALCSATTASAGGSSGVGGTSWTKYQSASLFDSAATVLSWFLSFTNSPNPVGPTDDALKIANSFADGAEKFSEAIPEFEPALEFSLSLVVGEGQPVQSRTDLNLIQRATREQLNQQHLDDFGLSRSTIDQAVEAAIEDRGLKAY
jgi:hypothetical protein